MTPVTIHQPRTQNPREQYETALEVGQLRQVHQINSIVRLHAPLIRAEAIPILGVVPSAFRAVLSIGEIAGGAFSFMVSGGMCCIPCPLSNSCTRTLANMQVVGWVHMNVGLFGVLESATNIATLTLYQCFSAHCKCNDSNESNVNNRSGVRRVQNLVDLLLGD